MSVAIYFAERESDLMADRRFGFEYNDRPIFDYIEDNAPTPPYLSSQSDFFVYVMGPYTAFNAEYVYDDADELKSPFISDPLFDPETHVTEDGTGNMERALADVCETLREQLGVRAFIATDIGIPTKRDAEENDLNEPGMTPLDQSVEFAAVSDAVLFIFSAAGLNSGVAGEVGSVLGEFNLRWNNPTEEQKPRGRLRIFRGPAFESASIDEIPFGYGIDVIDFDTHDDLLRKSQQFLVGVERGSREEDWPIFTP